MEDKLIIFAALGYPEKANPALPAIPANWQEVLLRQQNRKTTSALVGSSQAGFFCCQRVMA
jgi:hypothetical protein